jgi:tRNA-(ms[2]io[6]A)-hydroxylase
MGGERIPLAPTSDRWVSRARGDLAALLLDHAHCEKKAAATALGFVFRAPERTALCVAMSRLAREELVHFERLLGILAERGIPFEKQVPSAYAGRLVEHVRRARTSGEKMWGPQLADELLVATIIEARSTERFRRLAGAGVDPDLRDLFAELAEVEARHGNVYLDEACGIADPRAVEGRLGELCGFEATILESEGVALRLHAG